MIDVDVTGRDACAAGKMGGTGFGRLVGLDHAVLEGQRRLSTMNRDGCQLDVPGGWGWVFKLLIQEFLLLYSVNHLRKENFTL